MSAAYMYGGKPPTSHKQRYTNQLTSGYSHESPAGSSYLQQPPVLGLPPQHDRKRLHIFPTKI